MIAGKHVVSANKGPIAYAYSELAYLAARRGLKFLLDVYKRQGQHRAAHDRRSRSVSGTARRPWNDWGCAFGPKVINGRVPSSLLKGI